MSKKPTNSNQLHVIARAPFQVYYDGPADSLSATNRIGDFSILPGHADFFSMLSAGTVSITAGDTATEFAIERGLLTVRDNAVYLFVGV